MPPDPTTRRDGIVAGAVLGVLGTLALLIGLLSAVESHFPTRREYDAVLQQINARLTRIETKIDAGAPGASAHP